MLDAIRTTSGALALVLCACGSTQTSPPDARVDAWVDAASPDTRSRADARADARVDAACKLVKPYSTKNAVCNQCAESKCCGEINSCLGDTACDDDYVNCILACALSPAPDAGTSPCVAQCGKDYPKGKAEYEAATGCADSKCATECK
jgi:hypothetical protein